MKNFLSTLTTSAQLSKTAAAGIAAAGLLMTGMLLSPRPGRADSSDNSDEARVKQGLAIAPVPLNLKGKNHDLVGLGSYIVNAQASCNDCHTLNAQSEYSLPGIPYFGQKPTIVNPAVYLGGGNDFGPLGPPDNPGPDIISRNLTPDKTGLPEGGHTLTEFIDIMRNGTDYDKIHTGVCTPLTSLSPVQTNCLPPPFDGNLLQIMPWPILHNMTDHDLEAIYEYLKAIPCVAGPPSGVLHNDCP